jgi:carbonic anhydrase
MITAVELAKDQPGDLAYNAVRTNVVLEVQQLKSSSGIFSRAIEEGSVKLVGPRHGLSTGAAEALLS